MAFHIFVVGKRIDQSIRKTKLTNYPWKGRCYITWFVQICRL